MGLKWQQLRDRSFPQWSRPKTPVKGLLKFFQEPISQMEKLRLSKRQDYYRVRSEHRTCLSGLVPFPEPKELSALCQHSLSPQKYSRPSVHLTPSSLLHLAQAYWPSLV